MLSIRLPEEINNRLQDLATKTGRTKTFYVKQAILEFLEEMEDTYLALDRIKNPTKRFTLSQVEKHIKDGEDLEN